MSPRLSNIQHGQGSHLSRISVLSCGRVCPSYSIFPVTRRSKGLAAGRRWTSEADFDAITAFFQPPTVE
jgi:hypothetical protein